MKLLTFTCVFKFPVLMIISWKFSNNSEKVFLNDFSSKSFKISCRIFKGNLKFHYFDMRVHRIILTSSFNVIASIPKSMLLTVSSWRFGKFPATFFQQISSRTGFTFARFSSFSEVLFANIYMFKQTVHKTSVLSFGSFSEIPRKETRKIPQIKTLRFGKMIAISLMTEGSSPWSRSWSSVTFNILSFIFKLAHH